MLCDKGPQPTTQGKAYKFLKMVIFNKLVMAFAICCLEIFFGETSVLHSQCIVKQIVTVIFLWKGNFEKVSVGLCFSIICDVLAADH